MWLLLDNPVRSRQHVLRNRQADLLGRFQIDDQLELGWLLHRKISRLGSLKDLVYIAKIKKASTLIRGEVEKFAKLLGSPLVRTQITSFRELLQKNAAAALIMLWEGGALDPKAILDDMGGPAGLTASKEAEKVLTTKPLLKNGLTLVLEQRLSRQSNLIDQSYGASLQALNRLAAEHKKLEEDQELDLARLRETAAELRTLIELITKIKSGVAG